MPALGRFTQGRDCTPGLRVGEWCCRTCKTHRTANLSKDEEEQGGKSRAVRARQRAIGRELRRMYDGVVNEPVPDEFMDLLRRIDDADADKKKTS